MGLEDLDRFAPVPPPESDPPVFARGRELPIGEGQDGVYRAFVETKDGRRLSRSEIPEDCRLVETAGDGCGATFEDGEGADGTAMSPEFSCRGSGQRKRDDQGRETGHEH